MITQGMINEPINLTCIATAKPPPQYTWLRMEIGRNVIVPDETGPVFTIPNLSPCERGVYTCSVRNDLGVVNSSPAILSIQGNIRSYQ